MKCPKCSYITFDYLDNCPRCGKDLTAEKSRLNISSFKPNPPFFLGSLTGDLSDSSVGIPIPESSIENEEEMKLKDEDVYDDGSELDINMEEKFVSESGESDLEKELDLSDIDLPEDDKDLELEFITDSGGPEIEEETVEVKEAADKKSVSKESKMQPKGAKADFGELDLDIEDLDLEIDLEGDSEK